MKISRVFFILLLSLSWTFANAQCNLDFFNANVSACQPNSTFQVFGTIQFSNPPAGGVLTVSVNDGTNTYDTIISPPFSSPQDYSVSNIPANGLNISVTIGFSAEPGCSNGLNTQSPDECNCDAEIGTFQASVVGDGLADYVLCFNDQFNLTSTGGFVPPEEATNPPGPVYNPDIGYAIYSCPPTVGLIPNATDTITNDPCWIGIIGFGNSYTEDNVLGIPPFISPGIIDNTLYYVPITLYSAGMNGSFYSYVNTTIPCYELGQPYAVQFLPEVMTNTVPDCQTSTVTVTVSGGLPTVDGSQFMASNLQPATASFNNQTCANNGTIVISGLQNGDNYSFDITDDNGCPTTISGGPFVALPLADAGSDAQSCLLSYDLQANPSYGLGSWSGGPVGTMFTPTPNDPNATVTVPTAGTYTFTWTEDNGNGCVASDAVEITFSLMSIPAVVTNASCDANDGQVVVAPQGGVAPYTYSWTTGGNSAIEVNLGTGPTTITVTDNTGCSLDSTFTITQPTPFTNAVSSTDENCFGACDGTATIQPDGVGPYTYTWTPNVTAANNPTNLCQGSYEILVEDPDGCTQTENISIGGPTSLDVQLSSDVSDICIGETANLTATITGGTLPYASFDWVALPVDANLIASDQNPAVSPEVTTSYTLIVTDANGCQSSPESITIDVNDPLTLDIIRPFSSQDTTICPYDFATINLTANGGDGNYNIFLLPEMTIPVTLPIDTQPAVTTTFDFMVTDGCTTPAAFTSSTVTVLELPEISIVALPDSGCQPLEVEFQDLTQPTPIAWDWSFGDPNANTNNSILANPTHVYEDDGQYDVSLSITTATGCVVDTVVTQMIDVFPLPSARFDLNPEIINLLNAEIGFTDLSLGEIVTWTWNFGDGDVAFNQNPIHTYKDTGSFNISLEVITDKGCVDQTIQQVEIEPDFTFYVPNAFTPNQDDKNDGFRAYGVGVDPNNYQMTIFNRWGEIVFYTENFNEEWDGTYKGLDVEMAVYPWRIKFDDLNGQGNDLYGHVTLVR